MFKKNQKSSQAKSLPTRPTQYPSGTFVHTEKGYFYIVGPSKRYYLITQRALDSWRPHRVVETTESALEDYRVAAKMRFRNGSLIHNLYDGKMYLIVDGERRRITNPDWLDTIGAVAKDAVLVSNQETNLHEEGEELN